MTSGKAIVYGIFKEELKNRFLCLVTVGSSDVVCYIPASCRLSNFLDMPGRQVMLLPNTSRDARTRYSIYAVEYQHRFVLLNLSKANRVIEERIRSRRFSYLGKRTNVLREHLVDGYKADLYLEDTKTIIEIKSILSFARDALFPSVYTERGIRQLEKLYELLNKGYKVAYVFVAMNSQMRLVRLNQEMTEYAQLFHSCIAAGMQCYAYSIQLDEQNLPSIKGRIRLEA